MKNFNHQPKEQLMTPKQAHEFLTACAKAYGEGRLSKLLETATPEQMRVLVDMVAAEIKMPTDNETPQ